MSSPAEPPRAERRRYPPERSFALRLRANHTAPLGQLAGQLEHVMSGHCTDFADAAQLVEALNRWMSDAAAAGVPPTALPPSS
jgi:hypothetical protein